MTDKISLEKKKRKVNFISNATDFFAKFDIVKELF